MSKTNPYAGASMEILQKDMGPPIQSTQQASKYGRKTKVLMGGGIALALVLIAVTAVLAIYFTGNLQGTVDSLQHHFDWLAPAAAITLLTVAVAFAGIKYMSYNKEQSPQIKH